MAEILLKPSSLSKIIPLSFDLNDTNASNAAQLMTKRQFNTADTDAWFEVNLEGFVDTSGSFDITLFNLNDKSVFNHTGKPFTTNPFYYKLDSESDETTNEIRHAGRWIGQIVVTLANGDSATRKFIFDIEGHILDGADIQTILLEDYNALIATITASKDELTQYNVDYAALIADVTAAKEVMNQAEITRQITFDALVDSEMIAQNVEIKLAEKEATFAPRMLSVEQQLADTQADLQAGIGALTADAEVERKRIDNLIALPEGATTNDARLEDIKIGADGIIYDSPGNAVRKIGVDLNQNIIPLKNEFENGNFKNTGGWSGTTASVSVSENVLKVVPNGIYARILSHTINNLIVGDTYYISLDFKTLKETDVVNFPNFSPVLYFPDNVGMGEFTTISGISEATSSGFRFNMYTPPDATDFSTYEMYVKNAIAINLSKTFSDSNRPTKELLDALVLGSPTIWWGERNAFSQKQLFDLNNLKIDAISNNKLKVMSFNCGTWYDGVTRVPDIEVEEITFYTRKLFGEFDCDFVLGQEFSEYFDVSNTILAIPHVMDFKYEYNTEGSYAHVSSSLRCPVISKVPISGTSLTVFSSGATKRHYVKTYSQINGKNVCFISTLLDKNDTYRLSQMQQLITVMNQEEYVVLGGDFNIKDKVEYAIFTNAGYALANGGVLGWFDTLASYTDEVVRPIDNIIVSPNIRIENVFVDEKRPDDHRAIIAELSF